ncbi:hypothetical protein D3C78_1212570 [compost metagenome]
MFFVQLLFQRLAPALLLLHLGQLLPIEGNLCRGFVDRTCARDVLPGAVPGLDDQRVQWCFTDFRRQRRAVVVFDFRVVVRQCEQGDAQVVIGAGLADVLFRQVETVEPAGRDDFDLTLQAHGLRLVFFVDVEAFDEGVRHCQVIGVGQVGARWAELNAGVGFRPFRLEGNDPFIAQGDGLPLQAVGKQKRGRNAEREGKHRLQIGQVVGTGILLQHEQPVDVGVDQGLRGRVVLEHGKGVFAVFGFHWFAVELELRALEQQQ